MKAADAYFYSRMKVGRQLTAVEASKPLRGPWAAAPNVNVNVYLTCTTKKESPPDAVLEAAWRTRHAHWST